MDSRFQIWVGAIDSTSLAGTSTAAARNAMARERGVVLVSRPAAFGSLFLRLNYDLAFLEYWSSPDEPLLAAQFVNRFPIAETEVEMPLSAWDSGRHCGIPLTVPSAFVLRRTDGERLLFQYLRNCVLPSVLEEPPLSSAQSPLLGMEQFTTPWTITAAVSWNTPWPTVTPRQMASEEFGKSRVI